jgi:hypothetical protein
VVNRRTIFAAAPGFAAVTGVRHKGWAGSPAVCPWGFGAQSMRSRPAGCSPS